ncbi:MAG: TonB-dependent receptor [Acidobacteria bacterium]|nr:TonB-dependent receptor [Acidobacteriota bacterium]
MVLTVLLRCLLPALAAAALTCAQPVRLRVLDPHGLPVAGATVEIRHAQAARTLTSDGDGFARGIVTPAEIRVTAAGFEPLLRSLESGSAELVEVRLRTAILRTTVDVVVRDESEPLSPRVGTALEIERNGARTVFDAVERLVPGAFVTRRGMMGYGIATNGTGQVSLRGVGGSPNTGVLIVVDGRPDFQGLMGHPLPDFYSLSDAESVSITEGPASVLYGSNAMGGVVEIQPARPREGVDTRLSTSLGSFLTGLHRFSHGARFERAFYSLAGGVAHTRGERASAAFRSQDASTVLGYDPAPGWKTSLQGRYGHFHVEDPGPVQAPLASSYARVGRGGFSFNLDNAQNRHWGYARLYSVHGRHLITDGFRSVDSTTGFRAQQSFAVRPHLVADAGAEVVRFGGRARNVTTRLDHGEHELHSAAGFTRLQWMPDARTRLNAGLRYDRHSLCGTVVVPEFQVTRSLSANYAVAAGVGRGFRNPTIRELYLFPAPNPKLAPERLWNYQASFQARPRGSLAASVTAYYADLSNVIVTLGRFPNLQLDNAGRALHRGLEGTARWSARPGLHLNAGYAWLHSTNLPPLLPEHKWNYAVEWDARRAFLHLGGMSVGRRFADLTRRRQLGAYTLATLRLSVPLQRGWNAHVTVDNLLNRRYEVLAGYPMPGVNALAGMSFRF